MNYFLKIYQNLLKLKKITKPSGRKCFQQLNSFQQIYHDYNSRTTIDIKNQAKLKREKNRFCKGYHKIERKKAYGQKNNYINNSTILSIRKIPDLSLEKKYF